MKALVSRKMLALKLIAAVRMYLESPFCFVFGLGNAKGVVDGFSLLSSISRDIKDERGWTPLMLAARNGHVDVIEVLLKDG